MSQVLSVKPGSMEEKVQLNQIRFILGNTWPIKISRKTVNVKKTDRQTDKTDIRTYNTLKRLPHVKYMLDKLIIMSVNTTIKSDLCIMYHC